jgi:hypothetical protein
MEKAEERRRDDREAVDVIRCLGPRRGISLQAQHRQRQGKNLAHEGSDSIRVSDGKNHRRKQHALADKEEAPQTEQESDQRTMRFTSRLISHVKAKEMPCAALRKSGRRSPCTASSQLGRKNRASSSFGSGNVSAVERAGVWRKINGGSQNTLRQAQGLDRFKSIAPRVHCHTRLTPLLIGLGNLLLDPRGVAVPVRSHHHMQCVMR